jgi:beta-aspartyl-peptidase (threonine type)
LSTIIASTNGKIGMEDAVNALANGGSAVDAVEAGIRAVEANPDDHTVGLGGYPNILGEVELDASIMDGRTLEVGAVGALRGYLHAISVARQVMARLPHVFLVGEGAARFAGEMGFARRELLVDAARATWHKHLPEALGPHPEASPDLWRWVVMTMDPERAKGTVNFIVRDAEGQLCAGASTSGWAWKYPGRLGDSPVIGAGVYADSRYGAAACTGMGEMAIRAATAHSVVMYMKMGLSLEEAGRRAMQDLNDLGGRYLSDMSLIAMDAAGHHAAFTNLEDKTYVALTDAMDAPRELPRVHVPTCKRWERRRPQDE